MDFWFLHFVLLCLRCLLFLYFMVLSFCFNIEWLLLFMVYYNILCFLKKKNCCLPILNFWIFVLSFTLLMLIFESHLINQVSHITSLFSLNSSLIYHKWICNNSFHYNLLSLLYAFILFCFFLEVVIMLYAFVCFVYYRSF